MLEVAADNRANLDVFAQAWNPGAERANAAHDHAHFHPRLTCRVELFNHAHVHNVVELEVHPRFLACFGAGDFVVNELGEASAGGERTDEEVPIDLALEAVLEEIKQLGQFTGDLGVGREQTQILVDAGIAFVKVARAHVSEAPDFSLLAARHQNDLAVHLQVRNADAYNGTCLLQHVGHLEVVLFVKACRELHNDFDALSIPGRID